MIYDNPNIDAPIASESFQAYTPAPSYAPAPASPVYAPVYAPPTTFGPIIGPVADQIYSSPMQASSPNAILEQRAPALNLQTGFAGSRGLFSGFYSGFAPQTSAPRFRQGAPISYVGPTVSARPSFNIKLRRLRLKDVFNR